MSPGLEPPIVIGGRYKRSRAGLDGARHGTPTRGVPRPRKIRWDVAHTRQPAGRRSENREDRESERRRGHSAGRGTRRRRAHAPGGRPSPARPGRWSGEPTAGSPDRALTRLAIPLTAQMLSGFTARQSPCCVAFGLYSSTPLSHATQGLSGRLLRTQPQRFSRSMTSYPHLQRLDFWTTTIEFPMLWEPIWQAVMRKPRSHAFLETGEGGPSRDMVTLGG
jgi:hypothetical protein